MIKKQAKKVNKNLGVNQKSLPFLPAKIKNSAKKLKVGFVYYLTSLLVFISLVSIGFASWTIITFPNGQTATGTITAYDVINTDDYIQLDKTKGDLVAGSTEEHTGVTMFKISPAGFIANSSTSRVGQITAYYTIDYGKINGENSPFVDETTTSVTIEFYLRGVLPNRTFDMITDIMSITGSVSGATTESAFTKDNAKCVISIELDIFSDGTRKSGTEDLTVVFEFIIQEGATQAFYDKIVGESGNENSNFYIHARIY